MTTNLPAPGAVADAVIGLLSGVPAMRLDVAKRTQPSTDYVEVYVVPTFGGERRADGAWIGTRGSWRFGVRAVAKSANNADKFLGDCRNLLEFSTLTTPDGGSGVISFESADAVAEDSAKPSFWVGQYVFTVTL